MTNTTIKHTNDLTYEDFLEGIKVFKPASNTSISSFEEFELSNEYGTNKLAIYVAKQLSSLGELNSIETFSLKLVKKIDFLSMFKTLQNFNIHYIDYEKVCARSYENENPVKSNIILSHDKIYMHINIHPYGMTIDWYKIPNCSSNFIESINKNILECATVDFIPKKLTYVGKYVISTNNDSFSLLKINNDSSSNDKVLEKEIKINYPKINHSKIENFISQDKEPNSGKLLLLHGPPGTGKTTYIKTLINSIDDFGKKFVFINPKNTNFFSSPSFMNFAFEKLQNSYLVIEEAEFLLVSREVNKESPISDLLNITDGVLGDALNINIIATFNTDSVNLDKALLRPGRLFHIQSFDLLNFKDSIEFLNYNLKMTNFDLSNLGIKLNEQNSLAELYELVRKIKKENTYG